MTRVPRKMWNLKMTLQQEWPQIRKNLPGKKKILLQLQERRRKKIPIVLIQRPRLTLRRRTEKNQLLLIIRIKMVAKALLLQEKNRQEILEAPLDRKHRTAFHKTVKMWITMFVLNSKKKARNLRPRPVRKLI